MESATCRRGIPPVRPRFERDDCQGRRPVQRDAGTRPNTLLLIGVGDGDRTTVLGIPVTLGSDLRAPAIVEAGFRDFKVTPSQGTHFFQT